MKLSGQVKSISHLKAHAADMIVEVTRRKAPFVITQNGEATAVLQDVESYEQTQETLALLRILALGTADIEAGRTKPFRQAFRDIRRRVKATNPE